MMRIMWRGGFNMYFKDWITQFRDDDTPLGDLAYDISRDKFFPESNDKARLLDYLRSKRACNECISTFHRAWRKFSCDGV
jgi:uncharacterized protein YozE (UPF0346 family)